MDEASSLADKIAILKNGSIEYSGTNMKIINKYGKYITIQINKKKDEKSRQLLHFINENLVLSNNPNDSSSESSSINRNGKNLIDPSGDSISTKNTKSFSKVLDKLELKVYKERIIIKIPTKLFNFKKADIIFKKIEEEYKINNYIILKDQLEDAFINAINDEKKDNKKDYSVLSDVDRYTNIYDGFERFKKELSILFRKRFNETLRDRKSFILEILFPIILTFIACLVSFIELLENNKTTSIELYNFNNVSQIVYLTSSNNLEYSKYQSLFRNNEEEKLNNYDFKVLPNALEKKEYSLLQNLTAYLNVIYEYTKEKKINNNFANFYLITADENKHYYEFATYISSKQRHSPITFPNYLLKQLTKLEMKKTDKYKSYIDNIEITNSPFPLTYEEKNNKKLRNGFVLVFFYINSFIFNSI